MKQSLTTIFLATAWGAAAFAQTALDSPNSHITLGRISAPTLASPGWPFGSPGSRFTLEGLLARSDRETLSIKLHDQRVIRFRLDEHTRYKPEGLPEKLSTFHITEFVTVESEVDSKGYLKARFVQFIRRASPEEKKEVLENPEFMQRWRENVLKSDGIDLPEDDRRLSRIVKPKPISEHNEHTTPIQGSNGQFRPDAVRESQPSLAAEDDLILFARRKVNEAFGKLPNFRAKQVTTLFHSNSKAVKWIRDNIVAAEIGFEGQRESYSDIQIDGKRPVNAPPTAYADYMRSLDKAWSAGDFETLSHCVFSELNDSDFHRVRTEHEEGADLVVYEFTQRNPSTCISVQFRSEVVYPAYRGLLKVRAQTREVRHVELEAADMPPAFPLDRAERSADFRTFGIGEEQHLLPATAYWFGCFRNSYSCFLNRLDFSAYRRFEANSTVRFGDN
jgi:hypothetical protein